jgi:hypothetical protein
MLKQGRAEKTPTLRTCHVTARYNRNESEKFTGSKFELHVAKLSSPAKERQLAARRL